MSCVATILHKATDIQLFSLQKYVQMLETWLSFIVLGIHYNNILTTLSMLKNILKTLINATQTLRGSSSKEVKHTHQPLYFVSGQYRCYHYVINYWNYQIQLQK